MAALCLSGCFGQIGRPGAGEPEDAGPGALDGGPPGPPPLPACDTSTAGPAPLRRLTNAELERAAREVFGPDLDLTGRFPPDARFDGFDNRHEGANISQLRAERMFEAALRVGAAMSARPSGWLPCALDALDEACLRSAIEDLGRRAYRRPLHLEEVVILERVFQETRAFSSAAESLALVMASILMAPQVHFRVEVGDPALPAPAGRVALSGWEVATRLSFFLWGSGPDDALLEAAAAGRLASREGVEGEVRRMLADPRARPGLGRFFDQWAALQRLDGLEKSPELFPEYDDALRASMAAETRLFLEDAVWARGARLDAILLGRETFVDGRLAALYGIPGIGPDEGFRRVALPPERLGLLTQASFLASHAHSQVSSPVQRGVHLRHSLFCQDLPPPPASAVVTIPEPEPGSTNRERFELHVANPACAGCHRLIDPLGGPFEAFDALGRHRTVDGDRPVDASGAVTGGGTGDGPVDGPVALIERLAASDVVERCAVTQIFRYAQGRRDRPADACSTRALEARFSASGRDLLDAVVAVATDDAFRFRPAVEGVDRSPPPLARARLRVVAGTTPVPSGGRLELDPVDVGRSVSVALTAEVVGATPAELAAARLAGPGQGAFRLAGAPPGRLEPGGSLALALEFRPDRPGPHVAEVRLEAPGGQAIHAFSVAATGRQFVPPTYVFVGSALRRAASADGRAYRDVQTGELADDDPDGFLRAVTVAEGLAVAVGGNSSGRILVSADGRTWEDRGDAMGFLGGVAWGNGWWVAVGSNGRHIRSRNAQFWRDPGRTGAHLWDVVHGDGRFVAVGAGGGLYASVDGEAWEGSTPGGQDLRAVAFGEGRFVAAGNGGRRAVSLDARTWIHDVTPGGAALTDVAFGDGRFVAVGGGRAWSSRDGGVSWALAEGAPQLRAVIFADGAFLGSGPDGVRHRSTDGLRWTRVADDGFVWHAAGFGPLPGR